jgi:hypothetical protein
MAGLKDIEDLKAWSHGNKKSRKTEGNPHTHGVPESFALLMHHMGTTAIANAVH